MYFLHFIGCFEASLRVLTAKQHVCSQIKIDLSAQSLGENRLSLTIFIITYFYTEQEGVRTLKIRTSKGQNIESILRTIRTLKVTYLWRLAFLT
jgi:hypothetical protein